MGRHFHVSSAANRASILRHGLDWSRMGAAPGIAGSRSPEVHGCFLAEDTATADWFVRMNNTGGPVDVWEVIDVDTGALLESSGYFYSPATIAPDRIRLVRVDIPPARC